MCSSTSDNIQFELPVKENPFTDGELKAIKQGLDEGKIRRYGAALYHREAGYSANAMVAWVVDADREEDFIHDVQQRSECTHAYRRKTYPEWPYNYYTMIHGEEKSECEAVVEEIARKLELEDYQMLYSTKELKKISLDVNKV